MIGVGQPWRGDDAAGLEVATRLRERLPASVTIIDHSGEGASLMEAWVGFTNVVIVDAASSGAPPGTLRRIDAVAHSLPRGFLRTSSHAFGVAEGIEMARSLGRLPPILVVHAVEGLTFTLGAEVSPAVASSLERLVESVAAEVRG